MLFLRTTKYKIKVECHNCGKTDTRKLPIGHRIKPVDSEKMAGLMEAKDFPDKPAIPIRWLRCQHCGVYTTLFLKGVKNAKGTI